MKKVISISIDDELHEKAKRIMNISSVAEDAIKKKMGEVTIQANETLACHFCNREGFQETAEIVSHETNTKEQVKIPRALTWLYPDEKWICNACLRNKSRNVPVAHA